jgi:hypothetical protein
MLGKCAGAYAGALSDGQSTVLVSCSAGPDNAVLLAMSTITLALLLGAALIGANGVSMCLRELDDDCMTQQCDLTTA